MAVERIYWDSDAFLGWLQEEAGKVELCDGTLHRADSGEVLIFTSALTLAEVLWRRGGPQIPKDKADMLNRFFRRSCFWVRNVREQSPSRRSRYTGRAEFCQKSRFTLQAALVSEKITILETFDQGLFEAQLKKAPLHLQSANPSNGPKRGCFLDTETNESRRRSAIQGLHGKRLLRLKRIVAHLQPIRFLVA